MDKKELAKVLEDLKANNKRNFAQTVDIIFVLKNLNLKKP